MMHLACGDLEYFSQLNYENEILISHPHSWRNYRPGSSPLSPTDGSSYCTDILHDREYVLKKSPTNPHVQQANLLDNQHRIR